MTPRVRHIIASLMAAGLVFQSCGGGGDEPASESYFDIAPTSLHVDAAGGQEFLSIRSSDDWLIRCDQNWVRAASASGKASAETVKAALVIDENLATTTRSATLTVKTISGQSVTVSVEQAAGTGEVAKRGIASAEELLAFAKAVNEGTSLSPFMTSGEIVLLSDIDASSIKEWTPAGTASSPFNGTFNGKGHVISNISWTVDASRYPDSGIIGHAKGANIRNITVGTAGSRITVKGDASAVNAAAVVGYAEGGSVSGCTNAAELVYEGNASGNSLRIAGICGTLVFGSGTGVSSCINEGNVLTSAVARAAGLVAHSEGEVKDCSNFGCILAASSGDAGPAWGCSYNKTPKYFAGNKGRGHVGDYATYRSAPESAPSDAYLNAVATPATKGYELEKVDVDWTRDSYYDWTVVETVKLSSGVTWSRCNCTCVPRKINILEVNLSDPSVDLTTSFADDIVPNPNGNKNSNNGFNIRETLSQLCTRKRAAGQNVIAGINTGFFDSNDGIARGFHVEEGQPVYINNPSVVKALPNHGWAFTVFTDGTASCAQKTFSGKIKAGGKEFSYSSINDTIMRHSSAAYQINLYTSRYRKYPHPEKPSLVNSLATDVLYVTAEYTGEPMKVNVGYAAARVTAISDGRTSRLAEGPYLSSDRQVGIALSGAQAEAFYGAVKVGDTIELRCDITVDGSIAKPIYTQNSTMFRIMQDGKDNTGSIPVTNQSIVDYDPLTFPVVSRDGTKIWLVQVDGRQDWVSLGVKAYEMYRIGLKLGGYNMTRFDGGGSSAMWVWNPSTSRGGIVNTVCDSKGERSCMNYILIRAK